MNKGLYINDLSELDFNDVFNHREADLDDDYLDRRFNYHKRHLGGDEFLSDVELELEDELKRIESKLAEYEMNDEAYKTFNIGEVGI